MEQILSEKTTEFIIEAENKQQQFVEDLLINIESYYNKKIEKAFERIDESIIKEMQKILDCVA